MLRNYLKIAFRNFQRNKGNSLINIMGLAVGMTVFCLITQYISYEKSYDSFNKNADNIYRVRNDRIYSDKHDKSAGCPPALAPTLKKEFPEVLESARIYNTDITIIDSSNKNSESLGKEYYAEASFLKIFSFPLVEGSLKSALEEPYTIIVSKSLSQKYFGKESSLNKTITLVNDYGKHNYEITGIFEDVPPNSHIKFDILISYKTLVAQKSDAAFYWGWNAFNTYLLLAPNTDPKALEAKFKGTVEKYKNYEDSYKRAYLLQPLKYIHLHSNLRFEPEVNGSAETVNFLSIIALFVLLLAWINYINLSTCRSISRAKEVGIRKVLGSNRINLINQFIIESLLLNLLALILSIIITELALPFFSLLTGKPLAMGLLIDNLPWLSGILIVGTLLSGIYPAFALSSFSPIAVLKRKFGSTSKGIDLRKGLVVFQFSVSIILIVSTLVVYKQLAYMQSKDLGADIDQTLIIDAPKINGEGFSKADNFKTVLQTLPGIRGVSASSSIPGKEYSNASSGVRKSSSDRRNGTQGFFIDVDENYFNLYKIPLLAGRFFSRESRLNGEIILNEEAVQVFGFKNPEDAVGKKLTFDGFDGQSIQIVGVTKNYHQESLKSSVLPVIFNPVKASDINLIKYFSIKTGGQNIKEAISQIHNKWADVFPDQPFKYKFLDEVFNSQYKTDEQFGKVFGLFTFLAIFISCLGLFGLASFTNIQRTKEIGIRKVVGASLQNIVFLLIKDFTRWVLLANIVAWPVAYYLMNSWLKDFAYRTTVTIWVFLISGSLALIIALLTVSIHAIKAATANPVKSLKYE
jgi:putative ABC transport system permease protein